MRSDELEVEGYCRCPCGQLELKSTYYACQGICFDCFRKDVLAHVNKIATYNRARRMEIPVPSPHKPKKRKANRNRASKADHARRAALRRTKNACIDIYEVFYADERMKRGLPPVPKRVAGHLRTTVETYLAAQDYPPHVTGDLDASTQESS